MRGFVMVRYGSNPNPDTNVALKLFLSRVHFSEGNIIYCTTTVLM